MKIRVFHGLLLVLPIQLSSNYCHSMLPINKGLLLSTDVPTKQLILFLHNQNDKKIVLKDLDDTHVLIDPAYEGFVRKEVERLFDINTYQRKDEK